MIDDRQPRTQADKPAGNPALPAPSLPKGGGAIAPIGEELVPNAQMGTAGFTVPIYTSRGQAGFMPALALSYDAGALPRYDDANESDIFILSGAEDLVPVGRSDRNGEKVVRYRPRVEAAFARIERHVRADGTSYWVAWTRENVRSVYGHSPQAQVASPDDVGVPRSLCEEGRAHTNTYLKAVAYGTRNRAPSGSCRHSTSPPVVPRRSTRGHW